MNHKKFILESLEIAQNSRENGNHPFGALLVYEGEVVLKIENTVTESSDVTQHAELNLVSHATRIFNREYLSRSILYSSTEPCAMCAGAIYWSGIRHVVYGLSADGLGELTTGSFVVKCKSLFRMAKNPVLVEGPILEEESKKVHLGFWDQKSNMQLVEDAAINEKL